MTRSEKDHLDTLLGALREDRLSADEFVRLQNIIANDDDARRHYVQYMMLIASLRSQQPAINGVLADRAAGQSLPMPAPSQSSGGVPTESAARTMYIGRQASSQFASAPASASPPPEIRPKNPRRRLLGQRAWVIRGMAAAILVMSTCLAWNIFGPKSGQATSPIARGPDTLAPHFDIPTTTTTAAAPIRLDSGFARLTLDGGVQVLVEGLAEYTVISGSRIHLSSGRLTAIVPHSVAGFTVETAEAEVTDLGTEFGVIAGSGFTQTAVFDGRVAVVSKSPGTFGRIRRSAPRVINELEAYRVESDGQIGRTENDPSLFTRVGDYDERNGIAAKSPEFERWAAFSAELRRDPSLLAYYTFEKPESGPDRLVNRADATFGHYDGTIENAIWCKGRFPGKHGLGFDGEESRVKINIPEKLTQMTLLAWIRIDSWANRNSSILMSDGWSSAGKIHWQFQDQRPKFSEWGIGDKVSWDFTDSSSHEAYVGDWVQLAVALDVNAFTIVFYGNGVAETSTKTLGAAPLLIGPAQIGNWNMAGTPTQPAFRNRTLAGRIDELAIFNRVLTQTEIRAMYDAEKPE